MRILFLIMLLVLAIFGKGISLDTVYEAPKRIDFLNALIFTSSGNNQVKRYNEYGICRLTEQDYIESNTTVIFKGYKNTIKEQMEACLDYITYVVNSRKPKTTTLKDILYAKAYDIEFVNVLNIALNNPQKLSRETKNEIIWSITNTKVYRLYKMLPDKKANRCVSQAIKELYKQTDSWFNDNLSKFNNGVEYINFTDFVSSAEELEKRRLRKITEIIVSSLTELPGQ